MTDQEFWSSFPSMVEAELKRWDIPSVAIGVIRDGEIVYAGGIGARNGKDLPADQNTMYQIGSCSKAFTAALVGILVDQGKLSWDEPIRTYVPDILFYDDFTSKNVTLRDLLCHRTGVPRHEYSWYGTDFTREELVEHIRYFEPSQPFRYMMQYNNYGYVLAGWIVEKITGKTWEQCLQEMIFDPLGMDRTNAYICDIEGDANHATPFDRTPGQFEGQVEIPFYVTHVENKEQGIGAPFGAAGSINSTPIDMMKWVQLFLNKGKVGDVQLISEATIHELTKPQMLRTNPLDIPNPETEFMTYGMGWFDELFRGKKIIHHGGNINGFSAFTSFMPELKMGIVAYTNMNAVFLHYAMARTIYDHYMGVEDGNWSQRYYDFINAGRGSRSEVMKVYTGEKVEGTKPSQALENYTGTYSRPGYDKMVITCEDDALVMNFLGARNQLSHFHYDTFVTGGIVGELPPGIPVHFRVAEVGGGIDSLKMPLVMERGGSLVVFRKEK